MWRCVKHLVILCTILRKWLTKLQHDHQEQGTKLATFTANLFANLCYHSLWCPKRLQHGVLLVNLLSLKNAGGVFLSFPLNLRSPSISGHLKNRDFIFFATHLLWSIPFPACKLNVHKRCHMRVANNCGVDPKKMASCLRDLGLTVNKLSESMRVKKVCK